MRGNVLGIEIDETSIKLMEIAKSFGKKKITRYSVLIVPSQGIIDGIIYEEDMIYQMIARELKVKKYKAKKVVCLVKSSLIFERQILMEGYKLKTIKRLLEVRVEDYIPVKGNEYEVDFNVLEQIEEEGKRKNKVLMVAVSKRVILPLVKLFTRLKLRPLAITVPTESLIALSKCVNGKRDESILFIDMREKVTRITIVYQNKECLSKRIDYGMGQFKEINWQTRLSEFTNRVQPNMECFLIPEIEKVLEGFYKQYSCWSVDRVYLIGEGSDNNELQKYIGDVLNKSVGHTDDLYEGSKIKYNILQGNQHLMVNLLGAVQSV